MYATKQASKPASTSETSRHSVVRPKPQRVSPEDPERAPSNQAYGQLVQAKLMVGAPGDPFERQADRVADEVMRMPEPAVQRKCECGGTCAACSKEKSLAVQRKSERFGHSFSRVRVHSGLEASRPPRSLHARAYMLGQEVVRDVGPSRPEEPIEEDRQMKADPAVLQRQEMEEDEEEPLQGKFTVGETPVQLQAGGGEGGNRTGLPQSLKTGLEVLSGIDLSGIRVHNNSSKPAQLNALAYTQGQDIHVGPGQEKHLPHEGWHAVQQMQGRVKPTIQAKGVSINDDADLEREADVMGTKALQIKRAEPVTTGSAHQEATSLQREAETKGESEVPGEAIRASGEKVRLNFLSIARRGVEAATRTDLGSVRVHTGRASQAAAASLGARAYTAEEGQIHFGAGEYRPGSPDGDELSAHELVHSVQQGAGPGVASGAAACDGRAQAVPGAQRKPNGTVVGLGSVEPRLEQQADDIARHVMRSNDSGFAGRSPTEAKAVPTAAAARPRIQRKEKLEEPEDPNFMKVVGTKFSKHFHGLVLAQKVYVSADRRKLYNDMGRSWAEFGLMRTRADTIELSERLKVYEKAIKAHAAAARDDWISSLKKYGKEASRLENSSEFENGMAFEVLEETRQETAKRLTRVGKYANSDDVIVFKSMLASRRHIALGKVRAARELSRFDDDMRRFSEEVLRRALPKKKGFWRYVAGKMWDVFGWSSWKDFFADVGLTMATLGLSKVYKYGKKIRRATKVGGVSRVKRLKKLRKAVERVKKSNWYKRRARKFKKKIDRFKKRRRAAKVIRAGASVGKVVKQVIRVLEAIQFKDYVKQIKSDRHKLEESIVTSFAVRTITGKRTGFVPIAVQTLNKKVIEAAIEQKLGISSADEQAAMDRAFKYALKKNLSNVRRELRDYFTMNFKRRAMGNTVYYALRDVGRLYSPINSKTMSKIALAIISSMWADLISVLGAPKWLKRSLNIARGVIKEKVVQGLGKAWTVN